MDATDEIAGGLIENALSNSEKAAEFDGAANGAKVDLPEAYCTVVRGRKVCVSYSVQVLDEPSSRELPAG